MLFLTEYTSSGLVGVYRHFLGEFIFVLPDSQWSRVPAKEVALGIYDGPHATPKKTNQGPIFLGIESLSAGRLNLEGVAHVSEADFVRWTRRVTPQVDDLVFSY